MRTLLAAPLASVLALGVTAPGSTAQPPDRHGHGHGHGHHDDGGYARHARGRG